MRIAKLVVAFGVVSLTWTWADDHGPAVRAADDAPPSFAKDVKPFLTTYCQNCHNGRRGKAGYSVESYASLMKGGKKGPMIVPGQPDDSRLIKTLTGRAKRMPPRDSDQPTAEEVAKVRAWIKAGAKEDGPADEKKARP